jgi:hypothetical protein
VIDFWSAWFSLTNGKRLSCYTSKRFYDENLSPERLLPIMPVLEEARWVSTSIRNDPAKPYASQHARGIESHWWDISYAGWQGPQIIQFTDNALIDGKRNVASIYRGSRAELRALLGVTL